MLPLNLILRKIEKTHYSNQLKLASLRPPSRPGKFFKNRGGLSEARKILPLKEGAKPKYGDHLEVVSVRPLSRSGKFFKNRGGLSEARKTLSLKKDNKSHCPNIKPNIVALNTHFTCVRILTVRVGFHKNEKQFQNCQEKIKNLGFLVVCRSSYGFAAHFVWSQ